MIRRDLALIAIILAYVVLGVFIGAKDPWWMTP